MATAFFFNLCLSPLDLILLKDSFILLTLGAYPYISFMIIIFIKLSLLFLFFYFSIFYSFFVFLTCSSFCHDLFVDDDIDYFVRLWLKSSRFFDLETCDFFGRSFGFLNFFVRGLYLWLRPPFSLFIDYYINIVLI